MSVRTKIAFACHLTAILILGTFGLVYVTRREFMPYHSAAVGMSWGEVSPALRVVILAMIRLIGSAFLAIVFLMASILLIPFRRGASWAKWALGAGGLWVSASSLFATLSVAAQTPANSPWQAPAAGVVLVLVGWACSWTPAREPLPNNTETGER